MNTRQIIAFLKFVFSWRNAEKQESLLLNLPLCLISDIFDELEWPEKVVLSQTCKGLWYHLHLKCTSIIRKATLGDRLKDLAMLGAILPDHYFCPRCGVLHLMDPKDIAIGSNFFYIDAYHAPCPLPEPPESRACFNPHYAVAFRHVQMAIKLLRLGGKGVHRRYLKSIMQQYTASDKRSPLFECYLDSFTAEPRIVRGRFIVKIRFHFDDGLQKVSYLNVVRTALFFCPHHTIGPPHDPEDPVIILIRSMFQQASGSPLTGFHQRTFSCDMCPSDYKIVVLDNRLTVFVWHDLGTGLSLEDPYWQSHVITKENYCHKGTKLCYEHGGLKKLYYSGGTL